MQRGFLGASGAGGPVPAAAPTHASPPPPQSPPPQPRAPSQSQLAEVLDLCRGPTDERRLVGLLLATKLLPALGDASGGDGDAGASPLRAVCDAVGLHFLERLMLPLSRSGQAPATTPTPDPDRALKDAGGCALAVAVLSAFVRLPGVAADPAVVGLAPALIKVRVEGGQGPRPRRQHTASQVEGRFRGSGRACNTARPPVCCRWSVFPTSPQTPPTHNARSL